MACSRYLHIVYIGSDEVIKHGFHMFFSLKYEKQIILIVIKQNWSFNQCW